MSIILYVFGGIAEAAACVLVGIYSDPSREEGARYLGVSWEAWLEAGLICGGLGLICWGTYV